MKFRFSHKLSILIPVLILFLHSVTPHVHVHDFCSENVKKERKVNHLLEWLSYCLDHDLGEGHLEDFIAAKNQVAEFPQILSTLPMIVSTFSLNHSIVHSSCKQGELPYPIHITDPHIFLSEIKRGPPIKV